MVSMCFIYIHDPNFVVHWCTWGTIITRKWPNPEKVIQMDSVLFTTSNGSIDVGVSSQGSCFWNTLVLFLMNRIAPYRAELHKCCNKGYINPIRFQIFHFQRGSPGVLRADFIHKYLPVCALPIRTKLARIEHPRIQNTYCTSDCLRLMFCWVFLLGIFWMNELVIRVWMLEYVWNPSFFNISSSFILPSDTYGSLDNVFLALT